ncbi:MAG: CDP-alcohol phosphatidyltransferase family protein [Patescibacteria group bacterium]
MAQFFDQAISRPLLIFVPEWIHPNDLTVARATCLLPLIEARSYPTLAVSIVILSAVFDLLDGPLARARGQVSQFGAVLDATADKVFIIGALLFVVGDRVPLFVAGTIIALDVILTLIRPIKKWRGKLSDANQWGATKVWLQSIGLIFVLTQNEFLAGLSLPTFALAIMFATLSLAEHIRDLS